MTRYPSECDSGLIGSFSQLDSVTKECLECTETNGLTAAATLRVLNADLEHSLRTSGRPMALGVFGPYQVGKTFFVSTLAAGGEEKLWIQDPQVAKGVLADKDKKWIRNKDASEGHIDFMKYINTDEGVETTAVICRFTTAPMINPVREDTFVAATLSHKALLHSMLVGFCQECNVPGTAQSFKTILDGVFSDGSAEEGKEFKGDEELLKDLRSVWDRVATKHKSSIYFSPLLNGGMEGRMSRVRSAGRKRLVRLASLLWGFEQFPALTKMYEKLLATLEKIHFAPYIEIRANVVASGADSPVYVPQLERLLKDSSNTTKVFVRTKDGEEFEESLTIPELSAIIAELYLPVYQRENSSGASVLENGDILDFPGAVPPRKEDGFRPEDLRNDEGLENAGKVLKRGKLSYLFERYCIDREITALALCLTRDKLDAHVIPRQVDRWLNTMYHSYDNMPDDSRQNPPLFLVITMFDIFFKPRIADKTKDVNRFDAFLYRMKDFLESSSDLKWFSTWPQPGARKRRGPFSNVFWIRNPKVCQLTDNFEEVKQELFLEYKESELVEKHVCNKLDRWDAACPDANANTGISLLQSALCSVFQGDLKREMLRSDFKHFCGEVHSILEKLFVPLQIDKRNEKARIAGDKLISEIRCNLDKRPLGPIFRTFSLSASTFQDVFDDAAETQPPVDEFINKLIEKWREHMIESLEAPNTSAKLNISSGALARLVEELAVRAHSSDFKKILHDSLSPFFANVSGLPVFESIIKQVCLNSWSDFVMSLGWKIASPPVPFLPPVPNMRQGSNPQPFLRYFEHWRKYLPAMYGENCQGMIQVPPYNDRIGHLLEELEEILQSADIGDAR